MLKRVTDKNLCIYLCTKRIYLEKLLCIEQVDYNKCVKMCTAIVTAISSS